MRLEARMRGYLDLQITEAVLLPPATPIEWCMPALSIIFAIKTPPVHP
ncbi:hypothetical protein [Algibacter lectus]|nr:hypothetical protein [Algibacter lectus]